MPVVYHLTNLLALLSDKLLAISMSFFPKI